MALIGDSVFGLITYSESFANETQERGNENVDESSSAYSVDFLQKSSKWDLRVKGVLIDDSAPRDIEALKTHKDNLIACFKNFDQTGGHNLLAQYMGEIPATAHIIPVSLEIEGGTWTNFIDYSASFLVKLAPPSSSYLTYEDEMMTAKGFALDLWDGTEVRDSYSVQQNVKTETLEGIQIGYQVVLNRTLSGNIKASDDMCWKLACDLYDNLVNFRNSPETFETSNELSTWNITRVELSKNIWNQTISYTIEGYQYIEMQSYGMIEWFDLEWWAGAVISRNRRIRNKTIVSQYRVEETVNLSLNMQVPENIDATTCQRMIDQARALKLKDTATSDGYYVVDVSISEEPSGGRYTVSINASKYEDGNTGDLNILGINIWNGSSVTYTRGTDAQAFLATETVKIDATINWPEDATYAQANAWVNNVKTLAASNTKEVIFRQIGSTYYRITDVNTSIVQTTQTATYSITAIKQTAVDVLTSSGYATSSDTGFASSLIIPSGHFPLEATHALSYSIDPFTEARTRTLAIEGTVRQLGESTFGDIKSYLEAIEAAWTPIGSSGLTVGDRGSWRCTEFRANYDPRQQVGTFNVTFDDAINNSVSFAGVQIYNVNYTITGNPRWASYTNNASDGEIMQWQGAGLSKLNMTGSFRPADFSTLYNHLDTNASNPTYTGFLGYSGYIEQGWNVSIEKGKVDDVGKVSFSMLLTPELTE